MEAFNSPHAGLESSGGQEWDGQWFVQLEETLRKLARHGGSQIGAKEVMRTNFTQKGMRSDFHQDMQPVDELLQELLTDLNLALALSQSYFSEILRSLLSLDGLCTLHLSP